MKRLFAAGILILLVINAALLSACIDTAPRTVNVTPGPTAEPLVQETPVPTEAAEEYTPAPTEEFGVVKDALGNVINGAEHYIRYITFTDLVVYEEDGDTFLDGIINNNYPLPIVCAVDIVYCDEQEVELARAQLQTRDGNYLLVLAPGENVVFAHILTDMTLMDKEFTLEFDTSVGVHPQQ